MGRRIATQFKMWDYPTMPTTTADKKKRVIIPGAQPGDIFDVQVEGEEKVVLVRLVKPKAKPRMGRVQSLRAIAAAPLRPRMGWDELRRLTREP
jgi:hypothetical protein